MKNIKIIAEEIYKECSSDIDYNKYLVHTPESGGEYYVLHVPKDKKPPKENDNLILKGKEVVVFSIKTPEDFAKGRGGPVADSMIKNEIGWSVNCLPKGHKYLS